MDGTIEVIPIRSIGKLDQTVTGALIEITAPDPGCGTDGSSGNALVNHSGKRILVIGVPPVHNGGILTRKQLTLL